jgi:hypothetical protein
VTAIFAYVSGERAPMAADTLRVDLAGLFPNQTVGKVFCWANCIAFGGAGNGPRISILANEMIKAQGSFSPDEAGFLDAFRTYQPPVYAQATSGTSVMTRMPNLTTGTLLAAIPAMGGETQHILELDFVTGSVTRLTGQLAAQGTDPAALLAISSTVQSALQTATGLPGDLWVGRCIAQAVVAYPKAIGFPFDILATERDSRGTWIAHTARFATAPTVANPLFYIP